MSWFVAANAYESRRKRIDARHEAAQQVAAPPLLHPVLGLGGRSIELSLAEGLSPDPRAFELAVDELRAQVTAEQSPVEALREAGYWLSNLPNYAEMPNASRGLLSDVLSGLAARQDRH